MRLDETVAWYQKKIGTYDKQQWEKTVEQKILSGFTSLKFKNAKLKTEFIDIDLVRGSSFPKAKPKQSLLTVIRLAILRYCFLPLYAKWWVGQTSFKVFAILLLLYISQMINWGIYSFNIHKIDNESEYIVPISELLLPMALSLFLSLMHSQIVATSSANSQSSKHKKIFNLTSKNRERIRRRKKVVRTRSYDIGKTLIRTEQTESREQNIIFDTKGAIIIPKETKMKITTHGSHLENSFNKNTSQENFDNFIDNNKRQNFSLIPEPRIRKRSVNWDSPIHNYATEQLNDKSTNSQNLIEKENTTKYNNIITNNSDSNYPEGTGEDDGFESFNGKSSSGEENIFLYAHKNEKWSTSNEDITLNTDYKTIVEPNVKNISNIENESYEEFFVAKAKNQVSRRNSMSTTQTRGNIFSIQPETDNKKDGIYQNRCRNLKTSVTNLDNYYSKCCYKKNSNEMSETDEEGDDGEIISSPTSTSNQNYAECTTSATDWLGITTNSDECSYSSDIDQSDSQNFSDAGIEHDFTPTVILNPSCGSTDRISCTVWDRHEIKKAEMSVLDISSSIIERVEAMPETCDYIYIGVAFSIFLSFMPSVCRSAVDFENSTEINYLEIPIILMENVAFSYRTIWKLAFGRTTWERTILTIAFFQRFSLTFLIFFFFAVAERTFKQRFLYAKLFSHLTSSRRAQKSDLPHFRLNKVRNIKTWLSVRSYLKRRGPQRSIDVIVSSAFMLTLLLLAFLSVEWLKDSVHLHFQLNLEALLWASALGIYLLRFMTLGNKIHRKYRSISVLITEQINLYLQIEKKPKKKEELIVANSVLKLAADLLKELESPFKISGLSANPYLYTTVKVVILSALSGVLSEMLGFKLKLHKIKIK